MYCWIKIKFTLSEKKKRNNQSHKNIEKLGYQECPCRTASTAITA
jgi:hypothetical protein